jgi:hypothetical protein
MGTQKRTTNVPRSGHACNAPVNTPTNWFLHRRSLSEVAVEAEAAEMTLSIQL